MEGRTKRNSRYPPNYTRQRLYDHPVASDGCSATRELLNDRLNIGAS